MDERKNGRGVMNNVYRIADMIKARWNYAVLYVFAWYTLKRLELDDWLEEMKK